MLFVRSWNSCNMYFHWMVIY